MASRPIFVVGSLNIDLVTVTERIPAGGETLESISFHSGHGGKGANQAVAAARLLSSDSQQIDSGLVRMLGAVGDDTFGKEFLDHLRHKESINTTGVSVKQNERTGTAVIIVEKKSGENRILFSPGANAKVASQDIRFDHAKGEKPGLVVLQHEIPLEVVLSTLKLAKEQGLETILNPAPAAKLPDAAFKMIDHIIMNETEAALLSGTTEEQLTANLDQSLQFFLERGVQSAIITLGSKGAIFASTKQNGSKTVPAHKVKVVDTTAAGDTFVGAFAVFLSQHGTEDLVGAVDFGNKAASLTVQREGAQSSIPSLADLQ